MSRAGHWLGPLKPLLVPLWNAAHQAGWSVREWLGALTHGRRELCAVCGQRAWMLLQPRAIPHPLIALWGLSPRQAAALVRKETLTCTRCGARLRSRRLAQAVLSEMAGRTGQPPAASLADWCRTEQAGRLDIAEFNEIPGAHAILKTLPRLRASDFAPGAKPGQVVNGVRSEDLTTLTYPDESIDLALSSETLEHVPDLDRALAEISRVLRPGGLHIFTVPRVPGVEQTFARARLGEAGMIDLVEPRLHHPGGTTGYPVFTEFGADLAQRLRDAGFDATELFGPTTDDDLAQVWVSRKRGRHE